MPKLAVIGVPLHGHVKPVIPLLEALRQEKFHVDYYNTETFDWVARETDCRFRPYRSLLETYRYVHPTLIFQHREIPQAWNQLQRPLLDEKYDAVLYDSFCLWAKYLAMGYGLSHLCLHTTYPGLLPPRRTLASSARIERSNENLLYIQRNELQRYAEPSEETNSIGIDRLKMVADTLRICRLDTPHRIRPQNLLNTPAPANLVFVPGEFVSPEQAIHPRAHFLASLYRPESRASEPGNRVYASFGTRSRDTEKLLSAWTKSAAENRFHLHVAGGADPEPLQRFKSEHITIDLYVDQFEALRQACAFITHGGMNGVMEAILTETPMLVIPLTFEQQATSNNVVKHRLGMQCSLAELSHADLQQQIDALQQNREIKTNLKQWRQKIIQAGGSKRAVEVIKQQLNCEAG